MLSIFSYACLQSVYLLQWSVCSGLLPNFTLGDAFSYCWVLRVLHIFWITVLYQICHLLIFSSSSYSHSLESVFAEKNLLILVKSSVLWFHGPFGVVSIKSLPNPRPSNFLLCDYLLGFFFNPRPRICLLIDIERERETERQRKTNVREKHRLLASCTHPDRGPNPQPR